MFKNLFFHKSNRNVYQGNNESASPVREAYTLPTQLEVRSIDRQEAQIRQLEIEARTNLSLRFYMKGY